MLIEVKTTQQQDAEPKGAKRFEFSIAERLTRLPAYFALLIVGIAAYIRSIAAVQASTPDVTGRGGDKDGSAGEPRDGQVAQIDDLVASGVDETETGSIDDAGGRRLGGRLLALSAGNQASTGKRHECQECAHGCGCRVYRPALRVVSWSAGTPSRQSWIVP